MQAQTLTSNLLSEKSHKPLAKMKAIASPPISPTKPTGQILNMSWEKINEKTWNRILPTSLQIKDANASLIRITPSDAIYKEVVEMRHRGFKKSGFIPKDCTDASSMALERDRDAIILGFVVKGELQGTLTLNRTSGLYPLLPITAEKKIKIPHPSASSTKAIEFSKLVFESIHLEAIKTMGIACWIAKFFGKTQLFAAGMNTPSAVNRRQKWGFELLENSQFSDPSFDGVDSVLFYLNLERMHEATRIPKFIKEMYQFI